MRQGAVGTVRLIRQESQTLVQKRMTDPVRHDTEVRALRALERSALPTPHLIKVQPGSILMSYLPGKRPDEHNADERLLALRESATLLRTLHDTIPPAGLPPAPDDAAIVRRYREAGGPRLPLVIPASSGSVFCHGDWTEGNLLAVGDRITGIVDWEASHVGDPMRELSRAIWAAGRHNPRARAALQDGYGATSAAVDAWMPVIGAELWLWFLEAGPPEYLAALTSELHAWPDRVS